ncbi:MAG: hypothetical protein HUJ51_06700 [Eggerthellaceae bacterium]|nr:hypothetical protein [Eggerthellaceae bacterium]
MIYGAYFTDNHAINGGAIYTDQGLINVKEYSTMTDNSVSENDVSV